MCKSCQPRKSRTQNFREAFWTWASARQQTRSRTRKNRGAVAIKKELRKPPMRAAIKKKFRNRRMRVATVTTKTKKRRRFSLTKRRQEVRQKKLPQAKLTAPADHRSYRPNENKMSDGHRGRASPEVKVM